MGSWTYTEVLTSLINENLYVDNTLLKMGCYSSTTMCQSVNLLSCILTILLTCPNNNTLLCYSNEPFLTVYMDQKALILWKLKFWSLYAHARDVTILSVVCLRIYERNNLNRTTADARWRYWIFYMYTVKNGSLL